MATRTRTRNRVQAAPEFKSKSDHMRALFAGGQSVAQVAKDLNVTYGFAFGVAKRAGYAETAANRRAVRKVTTESDGTVVVQTTIGAIRVSPDGTVVKPRGNRRVMAPQD